MMNDATAGPGATGPVAFRTTCGRDLRVGRLALGRAELAGQPRRRAFAWPRRRHLGRADPGRGARASRGAAQARTAASGQPRQEPGRRALARVT